MRFDYLGLIAMLVLPLGASAEAACADGSGPQEAVAKYLSAMQDHRFSDAYDFVTDAMNDGKPRDEWASIQKLFYEGGAVNILAIDIRKALAKADDGGCATTATVPNVLKSRDKFNNQGTVEFELYGTVKSDGKWQVDSQETLFDQADVDIWFPGEKLPEFRDQY